MDSPIFVGIPAIVAKYKFHAPIYFWVQDLWPESITAAGGIKNRFVIKFIDKITRIIYTNCSKILVQSKRFIPYIKNQGIHEGKLVYHPNSTENFYKPVKLDLEISKTLPKGIRIMFAGNLGESQSFETLLSSAQILKKRNKKINWIILGNGRMKDFIKQKIKEFDLEENFILLGSFPSRDMPKFFSCADALLVSLKKNPIFSLTIPNKIQSYMKLGIKSFIFSGYPHHQEARYFAKLVLPRLKTISLPEVRNRIPKETPKTPLGDGPRF